MDNYAAEVLDLGAPAHPSPLNRYVQDTITLPGAANNGETIQFERAGPRSRLYFRPGETKAAIVTCGGLCPGLNDVVRSIFLEMHFSLRSSRHTRNPIWIRRTRSGKRIRTCPHRRRDGGRHSPQRRFDSRRIPGPVDPKVAVDYLQRNGIDILFCVGGDGTLRGAHHLHLEAWSRGYDWR